VAIDRFKREKLVQYIKDYPNVSATNIAAWIIKAIELDKE